MDKPETDGYIIDETPQHRDANWNSVFRTRVRGSLLGYYLDTKKTRYLVALVLYGTACGILVAMVVNAYNLASNSGSLAINLRGFWPPAFKGLILGAFCFGVSGVLSHRVKQGVYAIAVGFGAIFLLTL